MLARLRPLLLAVGLAVSVYLTYLALRDIDFDAFVEALSEGDVALFAAGLAVYVLAYVARVARWWVLFEPDARPPLGPLVRALLVGDFITCLMPMLRLGELARVIVLHREVGTPRSLSLGTVVTERIQDTLVLLLLLFAAVPFAPPVSWLRGAAVLLAVFTAVVVAVLLVIARYGTRPLSFVLRPIARLLRVDPERGELAAEGLVRGLAGLRRGRTASAAFACTFVFWIGVAISYDLVLRGSGLELGLDAGILVTVATTFSLLLPSLPASLGIFEAATLVALEPYGVDDATALSAAVVIHVMAFAPFFVVGPLAVRGHTVAVRRPLPQSER